MFVLIDKVDCANKSRRNNFRSVYVGEKCLNLIKYLFCFNMENQFLISMLDLFNVVA